MAYKFIVNKSCANRAAVLTQMWTTLSDMGWTLHDNMDGSSYRIYKSNGSDSDRIYEYIKIDWVTSNQINFLSYGWWNASTHAGTCAATTNYTRTCTTSDSGCYLWMYGDKNIVLIITKVSSTYYANGFGHLPKRFWDTVATLTSDATSGSNATLVVDDSYDFVIGQYYQIFGSQGEGRDRVQVASKADNTHLTISSLPRNYGTGAKIGQVPSTFGVFGTSTYFCLNNQYNMSGTTNCSSTTGYCELTHPFTPGAGDPDARGDTQYVLQPLCFNEDSSSSMVGYIDEYILRVPTTSLTIEDTLAVRQKDSGTATSGTLSTLGDTSKNWTTDAWQNKSIIITFGTGIGQIRKISSNNSDTITVSENWTTNPSTDSQYSICDEAYRYMVNGAYNFYLACREGV